MRQHFNHITRHKLAKHKTKRLCQNISFVNGPIYECLTNKENDYLTNFDAREGLFYRLTKVHKSMIIKTAIENQNSEYITCPNLEDLSFWSIVGGSIPSTEPFVKYFAKSSYETVFYSGILEESYIRWIKKIMPFSFKDRKV